MLPPRANIFSVTTLWYLHVLLQYKIDTKYFHLSHIPSNFCLLQNLPQKKHVKIWQALSHPVPRLVCRAGFLRRACDKLEDTGRQVGTVRGVQCGTQNTRGKRGSTAGKSGPQEVWWVRYQRSAPYASKQLTTVIQPLELLIERISVGYACEICTVRLSALTR